MIPVFLALLWTALASAQGESTFPIVTVRKALPIRQGPITFVDPKSECPPGKRLPVRLGSSVVNPPLLDYSPPNAGPTSGRVLVEATIQTDGSVGEVKVLRGPDELHDLALAAVRRWRFARTCVNGTAVPIVHVVVVTFPAQKSAR